MRIIALITSIIFLLLFTAVASAETPLGYPWLTWGEVTQTLGATNIDKGLILDGYAEQGVDWVKLGSWNLNTFLGVRGKVSDHSNEYWNNYWGPWIGAKATIAGNPSFASWSSLAVGMRYEYRDYFAGESDSEGRTVLFLQWGLGGDWKKR